MSDKIRVAQKVVDYFMSDHWQETINLAKDPDTNHVHSYVETSLDPKCFEQVLLFYLYAKGYGSRRKIDHMSPKLGLGSLHGVHPKAHIAHFDVSWVYNPDVVLRPMQNGGEQGKNLLAWGDRYMEEFIAKYPFREMNGEDEAILKAYFKSDHWVNGLKSVLNPYNVHNHINTDTSIHPDYIREAALADLKERGWKVDECVHCVFLAKEGYRGKSVFLCLEPERVFDISWRFNPDVVIEPVSDYTVFEDQIGYDAWTVEMHEQMLDEDFVRLDGDQLFYIVEKFNAAFR
jgi:hypothetical protein